MKWALTGPLASVDVESTGTDPNEARVVDIALALIAPGRDTDLRTALVNPGVPIPAEATAVHGITDERVRAEGRSPIEVLDVFVGDLALAVKAGAAVVAQNAAYDLTVLARECDRHGLPTIEDRVGGPLQCVVDPMVLDKYAIKYRRRVSKDQGARVLKTLAQVYGVAWDDAQAHGAAYDALIGARVTWRIAQWAGRSQAELMAMRLGPFAPPKPMHRDDAGKFLALGAMSLPELHTAQVGWYREQSEGLALHWERTAQEKADQAGWDNPPGDPDLSADERRQVLLDEARELRERVDGINTVWPVQPVGGAV